MARSPAGNLCNFHPAPRPIGVMKAYRHWCVCAVLGILGPAAASEIPAGGYLFTPSAKEWELFAKVRDDPGQKRPRMVLDPRLCAAARAHAADMQKRKFFKHPNLDRVNANQRALNSGYPLPAHYKPKDNSIESIAGSGVDTPADALVLWKKSRPHQRHVLGTEDFYRGQIMIGIGHAPRDRLSYATYVFLSAPVPEGQAWAGGPAASGSGTLEYKKDGGMFMTGVKPEAVLQLWKSPAGQAPWSLHAVAVAGPTGKIFMGPRAAVPVVYRLDFASPP